jgi:hypothetical protein
MEPASVIVYSWESRWSRSVSEVSCEQHVLDRALRDLAEAAARNGRLAAANAALRPRLQEPAGRVSPRRNTD